MGLSGFKKYVKSGIILKASDRLSAGNVSLEVGGLTETVSVTADAASLQVRTTSGEIGEVVTGRQIQELALNGRNVLDMMRLIPGVVNTGANFQAAGPGGFGNLSINGSRDPINKNFRISVLDYPVFLHLHKKGTIVATETNRYLQQKGIRIYSATGVGEKVKWKNYSLYQYVIAINAAYLKEDMSYALNIIGHALTSALRNRRIESKAKALEADLDKAREIQKSILPEHEVRFQAFDLYGVSIPDRLEGGDFFDYLQLQDDKDRLGIVIGDAASKGLSAAGPELFWGNDRLEAVLSWYKTHPPVER